MKHGIYFLIAWFTVFLLCQPVPVTERNQLQLIPRSQLFALSFEQYNEMRKQYPQEKGTSNAQIVERVGNNIRSAVGQYLKENNSEGRIKDFKWEFTLFKDTMVNAWAMPGGKVGVFTGILPVTQDENGLAVVMGHEIAHAVAGHGNERLSQLLLIQLGGITLQEALKKNSKMTRELALAAFGLGAQVGLMLPYSRLHETEADQLGLFFMALAGYDPRTAVNFWERMMESRTNAPPPEFLSTHPSDKARIEKLQEIMPQALEYYRRGNQ